MPPHTQAVMGRGDYLSLGKMAEPHDFEAAIALTGFGRFNFMLMVAAYLSAIVVVWDTTTMAYVIPLLRCEFNLSSVGKGALNAITYAGLISSCLLWGSVSDTIGRIRLLKFALIADGIFAFLSAFSTSLWMLLPLRFLVGFMGCTALPLTMTSVAEFHGIKYRSRCIVAVAFFVGTAQVLLPAMGLALLLDSWEYEMGVMKLRPWNVFVLVCSLPTLIGGLVYTFMPETPKFLMAHGCYEEALAVMRQMYATNTGMHPDSYPVESLVDHGEEEAASCVASASANVLVSRMLASCQQIPSLFSAQYLHYTALVLFIRACNLLSLNAVRLWLPQLFTTLEEFYEMQRLSGNTTTVYMCEALTAHQLEHNIHKPLTNNASGAAQDPCVPQTGSKRKIYINSMIVCSIVALAVGFSGTLVKLLDYKWVIILCCLLSSIFCLSVLWSTGWITTVALFTAYLSTVNIAAPCILGIVAVIFTTKLRATAMSLTIMSGHLATLIGSFVFPLVMELGCEIPFCLIACIILVAGLVSFALPYTKGRALT